MSDETEDVDETTDTESTEDTTDTTDTTNSTNSTNEVTISDSLSSLYDYIVLDLGTTLKSGDEQLLANLLEMVYTEAIYVSNRFWEKEPLITDLGGIIGQATKIAYENRGVEAETKNSELSQTNYFVDWHQYLRDEIVKAGKRYVI